MAANYWAKLWIEMIDDRKTATLPDSSWRRFIECILLAKELDEDGFLPSIPDMAFRLRVNADALDDDLTRLALAGLLERRDDDRWFVTNFSKRQARVSGAERVARHREAKRRKNEPESDDVTPVKQVSNDSVTNRYTEKRREEKEKEEKRARKPDVAPESPSPLLELQEHFIQCKAVYPNDRNGTYERDWRQPLMAVLEKTAGDVERATALIDAALEVAAGHNEQGKTYTVSSPRSLAGIIANLPATPQEPGLTPDSIWQKAIAAITSGRPPTHDPPLFNAIRDVGWTVLQAADKYTEKRLKQQLFTAYRSAPA